MKKIIFIIVLNIVAFCGYADEPIVKTDRIITVTQTVNGVTTVKNLPVVTLSLPSVIIDPTGYQNTSKEITWTSTAALIERGREILRGDSVPFDPSLEEHADKFIRIPKTVSDIYGDRAK